MLCGTNNAALLELLALYFDSVLGSKAEEGHGCGGLLNELIEYICYLWFLFILKMYSTLGGSIIFSFDRRPTSLH